MPVPQARIKKAGSREVLQDPSPPPSFVPEPPRVSCPITFLFHPCCILWINNQTPLDTAGQDDFTRRRLQEFWLSIQQYSQQRRAREHQTSPTTSSPETQLHSAVGPCRWHVLQKPCRWPSQPLLHGKGEGLWADGSPGPSEKDAWATGGWTSTGLCLTQKQITQTYIWDVWVMFQVKKNYIYIFKDFLWFYPIILMFKKCNIFLPL